MQYYKPEGDFFVGDCMPFFHDGIFRLYYLLDENHHKSLGGLGGHQWAQASTQDLVHWQHHPLAIPITDESEGSICTGSVIYHNGLYYGFYATRRHDWTQHLSRAISTDGIHFKKTAPNPFASPPAGYDPFHFRDPVVFRHPEDGSFHMLVTARLENWAIANRGGCLAHLVSTDLKSWEMREPFIIPGLPGVPECPDYFEWNGWYYLVFSNGGIAHYRMSRHPLGPWHRPRVDTLDGSAARVMKTAPFAGNQRLGVAWIGTREGNKDKGALQFGGNAVFRELEQDQDGTLWAKFPELLLPNSEALPSLQLSTLGAGAHVEKQHIHITNQQGLSAGVCKNVPDDALISLHIQPKPNAVSFGLRLRAASDFDSGYNLHFAPYDGTVMLNDQWLFSVDGLHRPFDLEIVMKVDIIDVCINHRRTLIDRCPEQKSNWLYFYGLDSDVTFEVIEIAHIID